MVSEFDFVQVIIGVGILLFAAKLMAELFGRLRLPIVLGELIAGMIVSPYALGMFLVYDGKPLLNINGELKILGEIGAIVILFIAGLEVTPREFLKGGKASFTVGACGVIVPFFVGLFVLQIFGLNVFQSMLIATALTATSIAISVQVLREFNKLQSPEARLIIGAAIVDDILAIAILSVVSSLGVGGDLGNINVLDVTFVVLKVLGFFAALLVGAVVIVPRIIARKIWKMEGSVEAVATALFFGAAALAGSIGLSPIVGAFSVGMALSSTKVIERVEGYVSKLALIFAPLFFAYIGAQVDFRGINLEIIMLSVVIVSIAVVTKLFGCGLPSMLFLRDRKKSMCVGVGMISRGEVGLIVAGIGVASGVLTHDVYTTIVIMVALSTIITPLWLKSLYKKETLQNG